MVGLVYNSVLSFLSKRCTVVSKKSMFVFETLAVNFIVGCTWFKYCMKLSNYLLVTSSIPCGGSSFYSAGGAALRGEQLWKNNGIELLFHYFLTFSIIFFVFFLLVVILRLVFNVLCSQNLKKWCIKYHKIALKFNL